MSVPESVLEADVKTGLDPNLAAGDTVGLAFTREATNALDTVNANCYCLGLRIRFV